VTTSCSCDNNPAAVGTTSCSCVNILQLCQHPAAVSTSCSSDNILQQWQHPAAVGTTSCSCDNILQLWQHPAAVTTSWFADLLRLCRPRSLELQPSRSEIHAQGISADTDPTFTHARFLGELLQSQDGVSIWDVMLFSFHHLRRWRAFWMFLETYQ